MSARFWWAIHNCVAHPLLTLWPRVGEWLHEYTARRAQPRDADWHLEPDELAF